VREDMTGSGKEQQFLCGGGGGFDRKWGMIDISKGG
jgi:hypothetical protein